MSQNQEAVIAQQIAEKLPEIVAAAAAPFEHVDQFTVLNGAQGVTGALAEIIQQAGALTGLARQSLLPAITRAGSSPQDSQHLNGARNGSAYQNGDRNGRRKRQNSCHDHGPGPRRDGSQRGACDSVTTDLPELSLSAPEAATTVGTAEAEREVTIDPEAAKRIDAMVTTFVGGLRSMDVHGDDYRRRADDIDGLADREIRSTADMSNRLLDRPTRAMRGLGQGDAPIAKSLLDLRRSVEELNPAKHDLTQGGPRKLLGVVPFGDRVRAYFAKYQKSQSHIEAIVGALREGGAELERDNAAIGQEQKALWSQMETLRQYTYMAEKLDSGTRGSDQPPGHRRPRASQGPPGGHPLPRPAPPPGDPHPARGRGAGICGTAGGGGEQPRTDPGRSNGDDHDGGRTPDRGHGRPGAHQSEARQRTGQSGQ